MNKVNVSRCFTTIFSVASPVAFQVGVAMLQVCGQVERPCVDDSQLVRGARSGTLVFRTPLTQAGSEDSCCRRHRHTGAADRHNQGQGIICPSSRYDAQLARRAGPDREDQQTTRGGRARPTAVQFSTFRIFYTFVKQVFRKFPSRENSLTLTYICS